MLNLTGLHLLLTYQCTFECDHCFVWGSPWQPGVMKLAEVGAVLQQARDIGTVEWIYFEGGEPFLYYPVLLKAVQAAAQQGFKVGLVSNAYWAVSLEDALEWLAPLAGLVQDLSVSSDLFHWDVDVSQQAQNASAAARRLGIPVGMLSVAQPETALEAVRGQLKHDGSPVMFRGRAAEKLAQRVPHWPWQQFDECPYEDLRQPGRIHVDPFGELHICQGISIGNLFATPLAEICRQYEPTAHPIVAPLLAGGPAELVRRYGLPAGAYADACHLCYTARLDLRARFPAILKPDQMYGVAN